MNSVKSVILCIILALAGLLSYGPLRTKATEKKTAPLKEMAITEPARTKETQPTEVWINIFVHGIMSIKPHLNVSNFMRFMRDNVENTTYSKTVEIMRQDPLYYKNQAMQGFGLQKVSPCDAVVGNASGALACILDDVTSLSHGQHIKNHYYTYGWSGLLSHTRRYKDAIDLYKNIEKEVQAFKARGITPKIRLYGYSHGGNVVLNLGAVRQKENVQKDLVIDEALLLGTPIQKETDYLINDQLFKKIYNIYSASDRVQKMDFFSFNRAFSRRIFSPREGFSLPKKLVQINLKITRLMSARRNKVNKFAASMNFNCKAILSGKSHLLRDSSPGHGELWFFGWTPVHYRSKFSFNPLPAVAIAPFILKTVQEIEDLLSPENPVVFDIRPEHGVTLIKNVKNQKFYKIVDFISNQELTKLQDKAELYAPENYTAQEYEEHVQIAFDKAHEIYKHEWSPQARHKQFAQERKERKQANIRQKCK